MSTHDSNCAHDSIPFTPPGPFQTMAAVREYVYGERIQCLIFGNWYRRLQYLPLLGHDMTADDYRQRFGIPWSVSLTSAPSRYATSSKMTPERIAAFLQVCSPPRHWITHVRPTAPAVHNEWKKNARLGRYLTQQYVTTGCATCGAPVQTTALTAVQPIHCERCATPGALRARAYSKRKRQRKLAHSSEIQPDSER